MRELPRDWIVQHWDQDAGQLTIDAESPKQRLAEVNTAGIESEEDEQEVFAIGRLMAAAPDMLDACRQALQFIEGHESTHGRPFGAGNALRDAIKKATSV